MSRLPVAQVVDELTEELRREDPVWCLCRGLRPADPTKLTDWSPEAIEGRARAFQRYNSLIRGARTSSHRDVLTKAFIDFRTRVNHRDLTTDPLRIGGFDSPMFELALTFQRSPIETVEQRRELTARYNAVGDALAGMRRSVDNMVGGPYQPSPWQVRALEGQLRGWAKSARPFVPTGSNQQRLEPELVSAMESARRALTEFADHMKLSVGPRVRHVSFSVGPIRYSDALERHLGKRIDISEAYEWAWHELLEVQSQLGDVAERISGERSFVKASEVLDASGGRVAVSKFSSWMERYLHATGRLVNGRLFNIPDAATSVRVEVHRGAGMASFHPPQPGSSRGGTVEWTVTSDDAVPLWRTGALAHHEGIGHNVQAIRARNTDDMPKIQQIDVLSGSNEGWGVHSERLMNDFLEQTGEDDAAANARRLDYLSMRSLRLARVIVDIGLHGQLKIPDDSQFYPGESWTPELAFEFMVHNSALAPEVVSSEIDRYVSWPGQASSYALGERAILRERQSEQSLLGDDFDLAAFNDEFLDCGPIALDDLVLRNPRIGRVAELQLI